MPKLALINRSICPPDGFRYVFPETGYEIHAWDYNSWVELARRHLQVNDLDEPPDLEEKMQEQLCLTLEDGWCNYDNPNRPRVSTVLSWSDIQAGLATFTKWLATGAPMVAQEEANRRAIICSRCYLNVNIQGCSVCQKVAAELVGKHKTKYDHTLKGCAVCKCVLRAKVHFPLEALDIDNQTHQALYPDFCWMKQNDGNSSNGPLQS